MLSECKESREAFTLLSITKRVGIQHLSATKNQSSRGIVRLGHSLGYPETLNERKRSKVSLDDYSDQGANIS